MKPHITALCTYTLKHTQLNNLHGICKASGSCIKLQNKNWRHRWGNRDVRAVEEMSHDKDIPGDPFHTAGKTDAVHFVLPPPPATYTVVSGFLVPFTHCTHCTHVIIVLELRSSLCLQCSFVSCRARGPRVSIGIWRH